MGYYVGTLANTLPLPGGIGGVEGGMIGSFLAFGVNGSLASSRCSLPHDLVLAADIPGAIAYVRLRRQVSDWRAADRPRTSQPMELEVGEERTRRQLRRRRAYLPSAVQHRLPEVRFGVAPETRDFRGFSSAPERTRTSTDHTVHKALNLARLPIPPQALGRPVYPRGAARRRSSRAARSQRARSRASGPRVESVQGPR